MAKASSDQLSGKRRRNEKTVVFTLHGIRTKGEWQDGAALVLQPFFQPRAIRYEQFDKRAFNGMVASMVVVALLLVCVLLLASGFRTAHIWWFFFICFAGLVTLLWAIMRLSDRPLCKALNTVHNKLMSGHALGKRPHVIAHSMGSLLLCNLLEQEQHLDLAVLLLDGCVVRRKYPWASFTLRFNEVFNEMGGRDWVPWAAALLRLSIHGIGAAGAMGFTGPQVTPGKLNPSAVGPISQTYWGCCDVHKSKWPAENKVHNIHFPRKGHRGFHEGLDHARYFWLPRLLNQDPALYRQFYHCCEDVLAAGVDRGTSEKSLERFLNTCFGWTGGQLMNYIEGMIKDNFHPESCEEPQLGMLTKQSVITICRVARGSTRQIFGAAPDSDQKPTDSYPKAGDGVWRALDPHTMLAKVVAGVVVTARKRERR